MLLKQRRLERGLTQMELATPGITQATIANIEAGKQWASKQTRQKIEAIIGPDIDWVGTRLQNVEFTGESDDGTGDIILAISAYVLDSNVVDHVEKVRFLQRALNALENSLTIDEAVLH